MHVVDAPGQRDFRVKERSCRLRAIDKKRVGLFIHRGYINRISSEEISFRDANKE